MGILPEWIIERDVKIVHFAPLHTTIAPNRTAPGSACGTLTRPSDG